MADKNTEAGAAESHKPEGGGAAAKTAGGGGIGAWLPLIVTLVAMPALAFAATKFLIVPQINAALGKTAGEPAAEAPAGGGHGEKAAASGGHGAAPAKSGHGGESKGGKITFPLNKMIVNVSGTMGTRYLCSSLTLVGNGEEFKTKAEEHKDQLVDLATSALCNKTIVELEKPGSRNQIRAELMSVFNEALGENAVQEIYFTEFAIQ
jgi:flagellar FliL protein